jgi:hypothetical protein
MIISFSSPSAVVVFLTVFFLVTIQSERAAAFVSPSWCNHTLSFPPALHRNRWWNLDVAQTIALRVLQDHNNGVVEASSSDNSVGVAVALCHPDTSLICSQTPCNSECTAAAARQEGTTFLGYQFSPGHCQELETSVHYDTTYPPSWLWPPTNQPSFIQELSTAGGNPVFAWSLVGTNGTVNHTLYLAFVCDRQLSIPVYDLVKVTGSTTELLLKVSSSGVCPPTTWTRTAHLTVTDALNRSHSLSMTKALLPTGTTTASMTPIATWSGRLTTSALLPLTTTLTRTASLRPTTSALVPRTHSLTVSRSIATHSSTAGHTTSVQPLPTASRTISRSLGPATTTLQLQESISITLTKTGGTRTTSAMPLLTGTLSESRSRDTLSRSLPITTTERLPLSASLSESGSLSPSATHTPPPTPTRSLSTSLSQSDSLSRSPNISTSPSISFQSPSHSSSSSPNASLSQSFSETQSASQLSSMSVSASSTHTLLMTPSFTDSANLTASVSITETLTPSVTESKNLTASGSITETESDTATMSESKFTASNTGTPAQPISVNIFDALGPNQTIDLGVSVVLPLLRRLLLTLDAQAHVSLHDGVASALSASPSSPSSSRASSHVAPLTQRGAVEDSAHVVEPLDTWRRSTSEDKVRAFPTTQYPILRNKKGAIVKVLSVLLPPTMNMTSASPFAGNVHSSLYAETITASPVHNAEVQPFVAAALVQQEVVQNYPYRLSLIQASVNISTGEVQSFSTIKLSGGGIPTYQDNVEGNYSGYGLYHVGHGAAGLWMQSPNAVPASSAIGLLVRPTELDLFNFVDATLLSRTSLYRTTSVPSSATTLTNYSTVSMLIRYNAVWRRNITEFLFVTRGGVDLCAYWLDQSISNSPTNPVIVANFVPLDFPATNANGEALSIVDGCLRLGDASRYDFIEHVVMDDVSANDDGWVTQVPQYSVHVVSYDNDTALWERSITVVTKTSRFCRILAVSLNLALGVLTVADSSLEFPNCISGLPVLLLPRSRAIDELQGLFFWGDTVSILNLTTGVMASSINLPDMSLWLNKDIQNIRVSDIVTPTFVAPPSPLPPSSRNHSTTNPLSELYQELLLRNQTVILVGVGSMMLCLEAGSTDGSLRLRGALDVNSTILSVTPVLDLLQSPILNVDDPDQPFPDSDAWCRNETIRSSFATSTSVQTVTTVFDMCVSTQFYALLSLTGGTTVSMIVTSRTVRTNQTVNDTTWTAPRGTTTSIITTSIDTTSHVTIAFRQLIDMVGYNDYVVLASPYQPRTHNPQSLSCSFVATNFDPVLPLGAFASFDEILYQNETNTTTTTHGWSSRHDERSVVPPLRSDRRVAALRDTFLADDMKRQFSATATAGVGVDGAVRLNGTLVQIFTERMTFYTCVDTTQGWMGALASSLFLSSGLSAGVASQRSNPTNGAEFHDASPWLIQELLLSASGPEITIVALGGSFRAAIEANTTCWADQLSTMTFQQSSIVTPQKAKAGNFTPVDSAGAAVFAFFDQFLLIEDVWMPTNSSSRSKMLQTRVTSLDLNSGGTVAWTLPLGVRCNVSSTFFAFELLTTTVGFVCVTVERRTAQGNPTAGAAHFFTLQFDASPANSADSLPILSNVTWPLSWAADTDWSGMSSLLELAMSTCSLSLDDDPAPTLAGKNGRLDGCQILCFVRGMDLLIYSFTIKSVLVIPNTATILPAAQGVQLSSDGRNAFILCPTGVTSVSLFSDPPDISWVSSPSNFSWCTPMPKQSGLLPQYSNPCHLEVVDGLCKFGGACSVVVVTSNNMTAQMVGYAAFATTGDASGNSTATYHEPLWKLPTDDADIKDAYFFGQPVCPLTRWSTKLFFFSAYNMSVSCFSVSSTNEPPSFLWSTKIETPQSAPFIDVVVTMNNIGNEIEQPQISGALQVSGFGLVVVVLRVGLPYFVGGTGWEMATYSAVFGLDAFTGDIVWVVEPFTVTTAFLYQEELMINQPRSLLPDTLRAYADWNSTIFLCQTASATLDTLLAATDASPDHIVLGIFVLSGDILFELPVTPSVAVNMTVDTYGQLDIRPLLLTIVPGKEVVVLTDTQTRVLSAVDISLFPLRAVLDSAEALLSERWPSLDAFSLFGTLDKTPVNWRPLTPLGSWDCIEITSCTAPTAQDVGGLCIRVVLDGSETTCDPLAGQLNWSAIPRPLNPRWERHAGSRRSADGSAWLNQLSALTVPNNQLSGSFDFHYLVETNMDTLDVSYNVMVGSLTSFQGIETLVSVSIAHNDFLIASLDLFNSVNGSLVYLQAAANLTNLDLSANELGSFFGVIHPEFVSFLPSSLQTLNLSSNAFTGPLFNMGLPNASSSGPSLRSASSGSSSSSSGSSLFVLDASFNNFSNPTSLLGLESLTCDELFAPLTYLDLHRNQLTSNEALGGGTPMFLTVPAGNGANCQLNYVDISNNSYNGRIDLANLAPSIFELSLAYNDFVGSIDLTELSRRSTSSQLRVLDVSGNDLNGILSAECPPEISVIDGDVSLPCENRSIGSQVVLTYPLCSNDALNSSMIYPLQALADFMPIDPKQLLMVLTTNLTNAPTSEVFSNCTFDSTKLLRFADNRMAYLAHFVNQTALCLPRNIQIYDGFLNLHNRADGTDELVELSLQYSFGSDPKAVAYVSVVPPTAEDVVLWCNFSTRFCSTIEGQFCAVDSLNTPYILNASEWALVLTEVGGVSSEVLSTKHCNTSSLVVVKTPKMIGVTNIFPMSLVLNQLIPCAPNPVDNGFTAFSSISLTTSTQIDFKSSDNQAEYQFESAYCADLPSAPECPYLPEFDTSNPSMEETCVDGFCAEAKTIIWEPCGTSIWNTEGYHRIGRCYPLDSILKLPMAQVKDPNYELCQYDNPAPCSQWAGRWAAAGVDLFLQAIQPDFFNKSIFHDNCRPDTVPECSAPNATTILRNVTDVAVLCTLLEYLSLPPSQVMVRGFCGGDGQSVVIATCEESIPFLILNKSECHYGLRATCSACLPYIEPGATSMPYAFMVISSLKDVLLILIGAYLLSKPWFRRPITLCLTKMLLSITPLNPHEKAKYRDVLMARFNPIVTSPGTLYDICDELLIREESKRKLFWERKSTHSNLSFDERREAALSKRSNAATLNTTTATTADLDDNDRIQSGLSDASAGGGSSRRSIAGDKVTLDNLLRSLGLATRKSDHHEVAHMGSLNAEDPSVSNQRFVVTRKVTRRDLKRSSAGAGHGGEDGDGRLSSSRWIEPLINSSRSFDSSHPLEQHSSSLFSTTTDATVLVEVDTEVLQQFYHYYREAVCQHSRRQIGNVDNPLVRERFQRLFDVYSMLFHDSDEVRERLMSTAFLDIEHDDSEFSETIDRFEEVGGGVADSTEYHPRQEPYRVEDEEGVVGGGEGEDVGAGGYLTSPAPSQGHFYSSFVMTSRGARSEDPRSLRSRQGSLAVRKVRGASQTRRKGASSNPGTSKTGGGLYRAPPLAPMNEMSANFHELGSDKTDVELRDVSTIAAPDDVSKATDPRVRQLEDELNQAREELLEVCEMIPIILVPTMVDARFTPQAWMLFIEAGYCMLYMLVCIYESATTPGFTAWQIYQSVYFRYVNSCASVGLVVNAFLRRVYLDEPLIANDPFIVTALVLIGPAIFTHILPGITLYIWIIALVVLVWIPTCWIMRHLEQRYFYTMDPISILFRVLFRLGTTIVATLLLQSSFNWALLFYEMREEEGYLGVVAYEYATRTWSCLIESRLESLANIVQFLSAFV